MLDSHVFEQAICNVVSLQLLLGSPEHPFNRVKHWGVLRDCKRQKLSLFEEFFDQIMFVDPGIIK